MLAIFYIVTTPLQDTRGCREPCHGLWSAPSPPADLAVTVRGPRCVIPRCGLATLPAARHAL